MNLFCLLLLEKMGKKRLKRILELADKKSEDCDNFGHYKMLNMILPSSLGEMHLRIKLLYSATTDIMTAAGESQKRQMCETFNELEVLLTDQPIESFFDIQDDMRLDHRKDPSSTEPTDFNNQMATSDIQFFLRTKTSFICHFYACNPQTFGITQKIAAELVEKSSKWAFDNTKTEIKTIETYIERVVSRARMYPMQMNMIVANAPGDPLNYPIEKNLAKQAAYMRRFFLEQMYVESHEKNDEGEIVERSTGMAPIYNDFVQSAEFWLRGWLNSSKDSRATRTDPNALDKNGNPILITEDEKRAYQLMEHYYKTTFTRRNQDKYLFTDPSREGKEDYDPLIDYFLTSLLVPEETLDPEKLRHPSNMEWWYATRLFLHKETAKITEFPMKFPTKAAPRYWQSLLLVFALGVVNDRSCHQLETTIRNNCIKKIQHYTAEYVHESGGGEIVQHVSYCFAA